MAAEPVRPGVAGSFEVDMNNRDAMGMTQAELGEYTAEDERSASVYDHPDDGCWYCGSRRHFAQSCPQPERERNPSLAFGGRLGR
jgi:hypothetical protein